MDFTKYNRTMVIQFVLISCLSWLMGKQHQAYQNGACLLRKIQNIVILIKIWFFYKKKSLFVFPSYSHHIQYTIDNGTTKKRRQFLLAFYLHINNLGAHNCAQNKWLNGTNGIIYGWPYGLCFDWCVFVSSSSLDHERGAMQVQLQSKKTM